MARFYSGKGDEGKTSLIGGKRVNKSDLRVEVNGTLDEASAAIGVLRSFLNIPILDGVLLQIQRDISLMMAEVASFTQEESYRVYIHSDHVKWLEKQLENFGSEIEMPREFVFPGEKQTQTFANLARTIVRRAERRIVELDEIMPFTNDNIRNYLNRLSSLFYVLMLYLAEN